MVSCWKLLTSILLFFCYKWC